jgi:hypothetical protein
MSGGTDAALVDKETPMNAAQAQVVAEIADVPNLEAFEVAGLGVVLLTFGSPNADGSHDYAEVTTIDEEGKRGWMSVRVSAGATGRFPRPAEIGVSGTRLDPAAAVAYAALITFATQSVLPTLSPEER